MATSSAPAARDVGIDAIKALASQLIVLHHLTIYGPMSQAAHPLAPGLFDWLDHYARMAVQAFLVLGGFLAARALAPDGTPSPRAGFASIAQRYRRLAFPYLVAMGLAIVCAALSRAVVALPDTPPAPGAAQLLAHALLLHGVLGFDSLSAGVWYVAIDFQLYALMVALCWLAARAPGGVPGRRRLLQGSIAVLALASLWVFNRMPELDDWAIYFFGAYALGIAAHWASVDRRGRSWLAGLALATVLALAIDFRLRIAIALVVALALAVLRAWDARVPAGAMPAAAGPRAARAAASLAEMPRWMRAIGMLGRSSYALFLVHYPVSLLFDAAAATLIPGRPLASLAGLVIAWIACNLAGLAFYRTVELRLLAR